MAEGIKVNQEKRIIEVDIAVADFSKVEKYQNAGYTSILHDKSTRGKGTTKKDLETYLEGRISDKIYKELKKKIDANENFLRIKGWLKAELVKEAKETKKDYVPFDTLIKVAKKQEKVEIAGNIENYIKAEAEKNAKKTNSAAE